MFMDNAMLTHEESLRHQAFVMALQALAATDDKPTVDGVLAEAERFHKYLTK